MFLRQKVLHKIYIEINAYILYRTLFTVAFCVSVFQLKGKPPPTSVTHRIPQVTTAELYYRCSHMKQTPYRGEGAGNLGFKALTQTAIFSDEHVVADTSVVCF